MARVLALALLALAACKPLPACSQHTSPALPEVVFVEYEFNEHTQEEQAVFALINNTQQVYTYAHQLIPIFKVKDFGQPSWMEGMICGNGIRHIELRPGMRVALKTHLMHSKGPIQIQVGLRNTHGEAIKVQSKVYGLVDGRIRTP